MTAAAAAPAAPTAAEAEAAAAAANTMSAEATNGYTGEMSEAAASPNEAARLAVQANEDSSSSNSSSGCCCRDGSCSSSSSCRCGLLQRCSEYPTGFELMPCVQLLPSLSSAAAAAAAAPRGPSLRFAEVYVHLESALQFFLSSQQHKVEAEMRHIRKLQQRLAVVLSLVSFAAASVSLCCFVICCSFSLFAAVSLFAGAMF